MKFFKKLKDKLEHKRNNKEALYALRESDRTYCLICGYDSEDEDMFIDDCPCCGWHMGYVYDHKDLRGSIIEARMEWINDRKAQWDSKTMQLADWSVEKAWEQIRANVPEKFQ